MIIYELLSDSELMEMVDNVISDKKIFSVVLQELNSRGIFHSIIQKRHNVMKPSKVISHNKHSI